jgi:hypothetical protein
LLVAFGGLSLAKIIHLSVAPHSITVESRLAVFHITQIVETPEMQELVYLPVMEDNWPMDSPMCLRKMEMAIFLPIIRQC